jgi:hypothetical protein
MYRLTLTTAVYTPAFDAGEHAETFGPMSEAEARGKVAAWAREWRALRFTVREGDGWATCATPDFTGSVTIAPVVA